MSIITLTSDLGLQDHYVAAIKGELLKLNHDLTIVDISHSVKPFDYLHAADLVKKAHLHFPKRSIHIVALTFNSVKNNSIVVAKYNDHYFIGQDNGLFSAIFDTQAEQIVKINSIENADLASPLQEYILAVGAIINNKALKEIGVETTDLLSKSLLKPIIEKDFIKCHVTQIDAFQNAITNLTKAQFESVWNLRPFTIFIRGYKIDTIEEYYDSVEPGELVAFFNSENYLEIAMNSGNIAGLIGISRNMEIAIHF